ncbi:MAG: zinc-ribbon domain-containing protein, partial [Atopobiaceae bacterium]|nr:zinc-ribbon domain-containing protein [Atopobiaceae bacterium]
MFCSNCGAEVNDGAAFCPKCGASMTAPQPAPVPETPVVPEAPVTPAPVEPAQPTQTYAAQPTQTYAAQPTQVVPQPVASVPPTSGVSQPAYSSQPAQSSSGYQPGAAPAVPAKKKPPIVAIVLGALVALALLGFAVTSLFGGSDPEPEPSVPEVTVPETP